MSPEVDGHDEGQTSASRRTYGRSRDHPTTDNSASTSMVFTTNTVPQQSPGKALAARWSSASADWRGALANLNVDEQRQESEEDLRATMDRLKRGDKNTTGSDSSEPGQTTAILAQRTVTALTATSSLTELPSSTPPEAPRNGTEQRDAGRHCSDSTPGVSSITHQKTTKVTAGTCEPAEASTPPELGEGNLGAVALPASRAVAEPSPVSHTGERRDTADLSLSLFGDEEDESSTAMRPSGVKVKPLRKTDERLLRRDLAAVQRNREAPVLRTEAPHRPVSEWLAKAAALAKVETKATNPVPPQTSPEDIRQFTPSSGRTGRADGYSVGPSRLAEMPSSSSPTPIHHNTLSLNRRNLHLEEEDENESLELALLAQTDRVAKQNSLLALKQRALLANVSRPVLQEHEDDLSIIPESPRKLHKAPITLGRQIALQPSKDEQLVRRMAGKTSRSRVVTETHMQFAGEAFNHAHMRSANAGARPAGQKKHYDDVITHAQTEAALRNRHLAQAREISQMKEARYGKRPALPPKQPASVPLEDLEAPHAENDTSDDDEDYAPRSPSIPESEDEGTVPHASTQDCSDDDDDKENKPVARSVVLADAIEVEDEHELPVPVRRSKAVRRVLSPSDDEEDPVAAVRDTSLRQAVSISSANLEFDAADIASGSGGFSQLFAETQMPEGCDKYSDGLDAIRNQEPHGLLPGVMLLPSVDMSDTQKKRDNALIAAEFEEDVHQGHTAPLPIKQYLNSEGFFTQSRPVDYMTQAALTSSVAELEGTLQSGGGDSSLPFDTNRAKAGRISLAPSPTQDDDALLLRLRRRSSRSSSTGTPEPDADAGPKRNAFTVLESGARVAARQAKARQHKSALVDEQAEESDEDTGWGYFNKGEDEDEEADDSGYIPDLVDDTKINEEEQARQDQLAADKRRQIEEADDARREADARKVTEGHYRHKRRGNEFLSDDEDEDGKPKRLTKKQRRQRKLEGEDGLFKMGGEDNAFLQAYEQDLESDNDFEEAPMSPVEPTSPQQPLSIAERQKLMRQRGMLNRTDTTMTELSQDDTEEGSQYSISRSIRPAVGTTDLDEAPSISRTRSASRSFDRYNQFVTDESGNQRRQGGGAAGVSVVVQKAGATSATATYAQSGRSAKPTLSRNGSRRELSGGSVLFERAERFR